MPRETYRVSIPQNTDLLALQRFATEINDALEAIARREAALEGRDGTTAQIHSDLQLNNHRICGLKRSAQDDEAVPRVELVERALYARRNQHIAEFPIKAKRLIIQSTTEKDSAVPLAQIEALAQEAAVGTASNQEILYNNNGKVDGIPMVTWDGSVLLVTSTIELDGDINHDGTNVGLYGATPVPQAAAQANVTGTAGGTANGAMEAIPDPADTPIDADALRDDLVANALPAIRNNIDEIRVIANKALTVLRDLGPLAT